MAKEAVGALDFLGLGKSLCERDTEFGTERERVKLVKPRASLPTTSGRSFGTNPAGEEERESSLSRLRLRTENSSLKKSPLAFCEPPGVPWSTVAAKDEDMGGPRVANRTLLEKPSKPLEELTDTDIMHLTQEDCRDYLKGRGMHRNTWSKSQGQGVMTLRHFEARPEEERPARRSGGSPQMNGLSEATALAVSSAPGRQHDIAGPSHSSGGRVNGFQPPRYNGATAHVTVSEEAHGGARQAHMDSSLTLSIPSSREQPPTSQSSGFGSPLPHPTLLRMLKSPDNSLALHGQRALQGPLPQPAFQGGSPHIGSVARSTGQTHLPGRPPVAQLTIFYSGTVNVYDDVPADKAQAIMLLAGSVNTMSSNSMSPPAAVATRPASTGGAASSSSASAAAASTSASAIPVSGPGPSLSPAKLVTGALKQQAAAVQRTALHAVSAELPQARKASLARFLEKRKDRSRGKSPYPMTPAPTPTPTPGAKNPTGDGSSTPPREKSPSPCTSKVRTRSPSPAKTGPNKKRSPSPAQRPGPSQSSGSETSSPSQRPGTPQPNPSDEQAGPTVSWRRSKDEQAEWGNQQHPQSAKEEMPEPMEEETGSPSQRH